MSAQPAESSQVGESLPTAPSVTPVTDESFASYLARRLMAEQGFRPGTVPEAEELTAAADQVLTYMDGYACCLVLLVDRERDPSRRFTLDPQVLARVGDACLKYTGTVNGAKLPMGLQVIEVGGGPLTAEDRARLERCRLGWFSKVHLSATHVDPGTRALWHNHRLARGKPHPRYLRKLLASPREDVVPEEVAQAPERAPVLTLALLALLLVGFVAEHVFSLGGEGSGLFGPSVQTLWGLGGLNRGAVLEEGQWWRLLTAPLLHGDVLHLLLNGFCLWFSALVLEQMLGRAWLWLLFVVGGVGGGLLSLAINPPELVSVGASGAIMGLLAAVLAVSQRIPVGPSRVEVQSMALRILVPSLIPLATSRTGERIDFAAHVGGALAGAAVGFVLARVWRKQDAVPPGTRVVGAVGVLVALAVVASVGLATKAHAMTALELVLIPEESLPKSGDDVTKQAKDLLERYPRDPRAHLFQSAALLDAGDAAGAEREARAGLAERDILEHFFRGTTLPLTLHELLGRALVAQDRVDEARAAVRDFCHTGENGAVPPPLAELGLCAPAP